MPDSSLRPTAASGQDLARQSLNAWKANAKTRPAATARKRRSRTRRVDRTSGRDPVAFAALLGTLTKEQGWNISLEGGSILEQWPTLCPELFVGKLEPVSFDAELGRLDLRPGSHAYAAQLRLLGGQLAKQINDRLPSPVVHSIRVLPVGALATPEGPPTQRPAPQDAPIRTRDDASPGYHRARAAALARKPQDLADNRYLRAARERQARALADPRQREPEGQFAQAVAAQQEPEAADVQREQLEASIRAARIQARRQKPQGAVLDEPVRLFGAA